MSSSNDAPNPDASKREASPTVPRRLWLALRVAITVGALGWLSTRVDLDMVWNHLRDVPLPTLATPFLALMGTAALHATRLTLLLRACGVMLRWSTVFTIMLRAAFVGAVSPRGGADIARIAWLSRASGTVEPVLASAFVGRVLDLVPWLVLLLWGLGSGALSRHPTLEASATGFVILFAAVICTTATVAAVGEPLAQRLPIFRDRAILVARAARTIGHAPFTLGGVTLLGMGVGALNVWSVYIVATGMGADLPPLEALGVVPAMDTVISLPVTISGVGLREGVFVLALEPRGIDQDAAVAAAWVRWSGEIGRAALGGALFALGGNLRPRLGAPAVAPPEPELEQEP